jgi:hypothetical protein
MTWVNMDDKSHVTRTVVEIITIHTVGQTGVPQVEIITIHTVGQTGVPQWLQSEPSLFFILLFQKQEKN